MSEQAVIVYLDAVGLPDEIYEEHDLATLEDQLEEAIDRKNLGEYDGNEFGEGEVTLYMYGPDAESLYAGVEEILRSYPLVKGARVLIRQGEPGAVVREVRL